MYAPHLWGFTAPLHPRFSLPLPSPPLSPLFPAAGLHPLAPYFTKFIADEVAAGLRSLPSLHAALALAGALLANPHVQLEHYVHQLLPPVLTCLVAKSLGERDEGGDSGGMPGRDPGRVRAWARLAKWPWL